MIIVNKYFNKSLLAMGAVRARVEPLILQALENHCLTDVCYYVEIRSVSQVEYLRTTIEEEVLDQVRSGKISLLLNSAIEAYTEIVDKIYLHLVDEQSIDPSKIILLSASPNIVDYIEKTANNLEKPMIRCYWFRMIELMVKKQVPKLVPDKLLGQFLDKKYLSLNLLWRPHRPLLVAGLCVLDLLKYGHVSLKQTETHTYPLTYDKLMGLLSPDDFEYYNLFNENKDKICKIENLVLDDNVVKQTAWCLSTSMSDYYSSTYFSLVTETLFFEDVHCDEFYHSWNTVHISEKLLKPITEKHPFICVARPHTLKYLRAMGYKTFDPIIDERYDSETNDSKRLSMILNEVKRLCQLTPTQLSEYIKYCKEICNYNFSVMVNKKTETDFFSESIAIRDIADVAQ